MTNPMRDLIASDLDSLLDRQKQAWVAGRRPTVEGLLSDSAWQPDADGLLDLLYNEIVLPEELGERPGVEEYVRRSPHLGDDLRLHFEVHAALGEHLLADTRRVGGEDSVPDGPPAAAAGGPTL